MKPVQVFYGPEGGGGSGTGDGNNPDPKQQKPNEDDEEFVDPFEGVDLDLLPEEARKAIEKAREDLKKVPKLVKQTRGFQSNYDKVQAELQRLQRASEQSQQQPPNDPNKELTEFDLIVKDYMEEGVPKEAAERAARIIMKHATRREGAIQQHIAKTVQPVAVSSSITEATQNFQQIAQLDKRLAIPEVAQKVWERVEKNAREGKVMSPDMISNLGKVFYMDALDAGEIKIEAPEPVRQQQQPDINTRFTFPGATASVQRPQTRTFSSTDDLDPETAAAVAATAKLMRQSFTGLKDQTGKRK